jgi:glycosyltransferase involved in cell wall biosynthesis
MLRGLRAVSGRRCGAVRHRHNGYVTRRALARSLPGVFQRRLRAFQPDLVLTQLEASETFAQIALQRGVPVALRVPDVSFTHFSGRLSDATVLVVANSRFVARRLHERFGISAPTVYSPVCLDSYRTARDGADRITFVNPRPFKGLDLALEIAHLLPGRRFLFQEAWRFDDHELRRLRSRLAAYPNVALGRLTQDMRRVYAVTRLLIVPSLGEDSLPRVILEAQASGIPVLARDVGGVAEVLIAGGRLLSPSATAAEWAEVIEAILDDSAGYERLSVEAERNGRQPAFDPETIVDRFLDVVREHVARCAASRDSRRA